VIFQFGRGYGLSAEFVGLVKATLLSLDRGFRLELGPVPHSIGFAVQHGWRDYFEPVLPEAGPSWIGRLNRSTFPLQSRTSIPRRLALAALRSLTGARYFMANLPTELPSVLTVPDLGLRHPYHRACQWITEIYWRLLPRVRREVDSTKARASLPAEYLSVHVRRGDKKLESPYVPLERYRERLLSLETGIRDVLVASDDPGVPSELSRMLPADWRVRGAAERASAYDQQAFNRESPADRWRQTVDFLAELELLRDAHFFVGSETSNVAIFARMLRGDQGMALVD